MVSWVIPVLVQPLCGTVSPFSGVWLKYFVWFPQIYSPDGQYTLLDLDRSIKFSRSHWPLEAHIRKSVSNNDTIDQSTTVEQLIHRFHIGSSTFRRSHCWNAVPFPAVCMLNSSHGSIYTYTTAVRTPWHVLVSVQERILSMHEDELGQRTRNQWTE